jgi:hypothetical protein
MQFRKWTKLRCDFLGPALVFCATFVIASERDARLLHSGNRQLTIAYHLTDFKLDTVQAGGAMAIRPYFSKALSFNQPGAPELFTRVFILGLPPGARAEVAVIPGNFEEITEVNVRPVPVKEQAEAFIQWSHQPDPKIYENNAFYPAELARIDPSTQFRQQTIARLEVMPVQYNPVQKRLRLYRDLQIVVRFVGGHLPAALATHLASSQAEEEFYENLLINYEQAKAFRVSPPANLVRRAGAQIDGPLYKFPLRLEGIYKLDGGTLRRAGINIDEVKPNNIHLYNNGGRELPRPIRALRPAGLIENAIYVSDGGDGRFNEDDYILFYGRGVEGFAFDSTTGVASHYFNHFGYDNFYWLSFGGGNGKRMAERAPLPPAGLAPATRFTDYVFIEEDFTPLFESDQHWFSWLFTPRGNDRRTYRVRLTDPVPETVARLKFALYAQPNGTRRTLTVSFEKQELGAFESFGGDHVEIFNADKFGGLVNGENEILLAFDGSGDAAQLYLDYFEIMYERQLRLSNSALAFNGPAGAGPFAYTLSAVEVWLFDVSDFSNAVRLSPQNWQVNGSQVTFADIGSTTKAPRRYIAALPGAFKNVDSNLIKPDELSNWRSPNHGADMVVITHEDFLSINPVTGKDDGPLARFVSLRQNANVNDTLKTEVVKIQDVFDEFSGGLYDPMAIRDFLQYAYENWPRRPLYVMLVGDGDYDPKNIINKTGKNWIPTYHTEEFNTSEFDIRNRVTDSQFTYVAGDDQTMDLAIGRVPARSLADVEAYVEKLTRYETIPAFGAWRNTAVMVADDEYAQGAVPSSGETFHIEDTETLINFYTPPFFDIKKIYLTEFAAVQSASISGIRKPTATDAFLRLLNNGALLVNYAGHGNPDVWAHERVLNLASDFERIQNGDKQALWVAATCTFGKYDMVDRQSFAEQLVLAPRRGAIAALATSRDVYGNLNARLNQVYYDFLFENDLSARIGAAMVWARAQTGQTENDEKFHVLGDPSLRLAIPRYLAAITSLTPDTIKALAVMTVQGKITRDGADWPGFNGMARIEALDAQRDVRYQSPGQFGIDYAMPGNSLFRGEVSVQNGAFTAQFFVPKDITYGGQTGRVNVYFWNDQTDGNGFRHQLPVGGTARPIVDQAGPRIDIGFAGAEDFRSGGIVGANAVLRIVIHDSLAGVNITGEIGHKITVAIDGRHDDKIDLTDLFNYDAGSYTRGTILYPLTNLAEGRHTVEIKAWDNLNNSNTATADFTIQPQDRLILREVLNYPNPFRGRTTFTFELNLAAEIRIKVFTLSGRLIRSLEELNAARGFNMVEWDGRDADGDELANGVYLYKIIAAAQETSLRAEEIGKLVVQR